MGLPGILWKLASPYDAYVSHVTALEHAIAQIRHLSDRALGLEAGLHGSIRLVPATAQAEERARRFRERLAAAADLSDEQFEAFITELGGGHVAEVESARATAVTRLGHMQRGLEEYFASAGRHLALLEQRRYNPARADIARQLQANHLAPRTVDDYRRILHELGTKVSRRAA
jgi:hypothetical protein